MNSRSLAGCGGRQGAIAFVRLGHGSDAISRIRVLDLVNSVFPFRRKVHRGVEISALVETRGVNEAVHPFPAFQDSSVVTLPYFMSSTFSMFRLNAALLMV